MVEPIGATWQITDDPNSPLELHRDSDGLLVAWVSHVGPSRWLYFVDFRNKGTATNSGDEAKEACTLAWNASQTEVMR